MEAITSILLAGAIASSDSYDKSNLRALRTIALYSYRDSGMEKDVKVYVKKELPQEFRNNAGLIVAVVTILGKKRAEFIWTF